MGFYIGKIFVGFYGIMIVTGVIVALIFISFIRKKYKIDFYDIAIVNCIIALSGIVGAKTLYLIINWKELLSIISRCDIILFNTYMSGGFVFFGGLISIFLTYIYLNYKNITNYTDIIEYCFPGYIICHAFGRVGCGIVGCCYGKVHNSFPYIIYHNSYFAPNDLRLFPTQYVEALFQFIMGIIFYCLIYKKGKKKIYLYYYIVVYSIFRFIIEFYRGDLKRGFVLTLSISQIISLFLISCLTIYIYNKQIKNAKPRA